MCSLKVDLEYFMFVFTYVIRSALRLLLPVLVFASLTPAFAGKPPNVTDGEMALIPPYCLDTQGFKYGDAYSNTSPRAGHWVGLMGKSFWHMHHYCWALLNMRRADLVARSAQERKGLRGEAVGDIEYVIKNSPRNFVLLPEILTTLGGVQILQANASAAADAFQQARDLKPDYWPAYSDWAQFLIKSGQKAQAKQLVKTGLEHVPDAKVLQDQFRLLGGDPAEVVPKTKLKVPSAAEPTPTAESPASSGVTSSQGEQKN